MNKEMMWDIIFLIILLTSIGMNIYLIRENSKLETKVQTTTIATNTNCTEQLYSCSALIDRVKDNVTQACALCNNSEVN